MTKISKKTSRKRTKLTINPPHGERSDFIKMTITMSPWIYKKLLKEIEIRVINKKKDATKSAIIREALLDFLV